jgi:hypothetical protein
VTKPSSSVRRVTPSHPARLKVTPIVPDRAVSLNVKAQNLARMTSAAKRGVVKARNRSNQRQSNSNELRK